MNALGHMRQEPELLPDAIEAAAAVGPRVVCAAFVGDSQTRGVVRAACERQFPRHLVRDGGTREALEYLAENEPPRVLVVDVTDSQNPLNAMLPIVAAFSDETRVVAIGGVNDINLYREMVEVGVSEYLVKPIDEKTLLGAFSRLHDKPATRAPEPVAGRRSLIAVMGARGGVGTSTVALNAAWLIAEEQKRRVTLLDLDLQCGTLALALDIEPTRGLREALEHPNRIDALFISSASVKLGERLTVMAAEEAVDQDIHYDPPALDRLIHALHEQSDCIVVDLPRSAAGARTRILAAATAVVIVTDLTLPALRDSIRLLTLTRQLAPEARIVVLANRTEGRQNNVPRKEFERALGHPIDRILLEDGKAAAAAANSGKPLAAASPKSRTVASLRAVTRTLLPIERKTGPMRLLWWRRAS